MRSVSLKLPNDLLDRLNETARKRRVTRSSVIRESLEKALETGNGEKMSCYHLASDLAGSLRNLPRDLAHNPKYMKDFGS